MSTGGIRSKLPLVSVIIPTYNRGWTLAEAVESVLAQDYKDFELIVVDDGSTDDTKDILAAYDGITVLGQANQGVSAARNNGVAHSRGTYVAFLDSDDLWLPQKLAVQVDFFRKNPEALICQTQETWVRNGRRVNSGKRHQKQSGMFFERSLELCLVSPSAVMMKKAFFGEMGGFDENLPACEDYDLWIRINAHHPIYLIDRPLIVKRGGHQDQLSANPGLDKYRIESIGKLLKSGGLSRQQEAAALQVLKKKCRIYAEGCRKRGRLEEAKYYQCLKPT
ncbi:MAG: glycosyltransferase [Thermodesulfobacteriota bacterium]